LPKAVASFEESVWVSPEATIKIVDDSGDYEYRSWVTDQFAYPLVSVGEHALGYNAAMLKIWELARSYDHVFMVEDDFVFNREVDLADMIEVLDFDLGIAQLVLLRQAWFGNEVAAGGLIPALQQMGHGVDEAGVLMNRLLVHRATWSTNPNLFRGGDWVEDHPWPIGDGSEYRFGQALFATEPDTVCAYWGNGEEYVTHDGARKGYGY
jgi:hypothetical protein